MASDRSTCSCGQVMTWAISETGRRMPLQEDDKGNYVIRDGRAVDEKFEPLFASIGEQRYTSHHATCPDVAKYRGKKQ